MPMPDYPYCHAPLKIRKLRALFECWPRIGNGNEVWLCTTLNEHNGSLDGGYVRNRDGTCVVPTESMVSWRRLREPVEEVKRLKGRRPRRGYQHLGGVFMLDPWGNVAIPRTEEFELRDDVEWYTNGKFGDFLWFGMPYGRACHDGHGAYKLGDPWYGPADGLAFIVTDAGRIKLSGDQGHSTYELDYLDSPEARLLERDFALRFEAIGEPPGRFYVNYREEAFTALTQRYLGRCPVSQIFRDPTPDRNLLYSAINSACHELHSAPDLELVFVTTGGQVKRARVRQTDAMDGRGLKATDVHTGRRLLYRYERIIKFLVL
jgi:hypothetical protein